MELSDQQRDMVSSGERETYAGAIFFGHLTAALSLFNEVSFLVAEWADSHANRNLREHGILGRPPLEDVSTALLPHRWKLMDILYKDIIDNYQTYLEHVVKAGLRESGKKVNERYSMRGAIKRLREEFQTEPDHREGRGRWILDLCDKRNKLTHNWAMVRGQNQRVGTPVIISEALVFEAATILSDSVRHIERELIAQLPSLELRDSGPQLC